MKLMNFTKTLKEKHGSKYDVPKLWLINEPE